MVEYIKSIVIDNMEYMFRQGSHIKLYSENNTNYLEYNMKKYKLNDRYNLPSKNNTCIKIKSKINDEIIINVSDNIDYAVSFSYQDDTIYPGQSKSKFLPGTEETTIYVHKISKYSENNIQIKFVGDYVEEDVVDVDDEEIENQFKRMYESDTCIKTHNSNNTISNNDKKYYTDIDILFNASKLDCLSKIGDGSFRNVYEVLNEGKLDINIKNNKYVLKVAKNKNGIKSNKREFQTWQAVKGTELEQHFCPIFDRGPEYKYIIMKKVQDLTDSNSDNSSTIVDNLRSTITDKIDKEQIDPPLIDEFDIFSSNVGVDDNNNYVIIDYPYGANFEHL